MSPYLAKINSIQDEWHKLIMEWLSEDEQKTLSSKPPLELQTTILRWLTHSTIIVPYGNGTLTSFEYRLNSLLQAVNDFWQQRFNDFLTAFNEYNAYSLELPVYNLYSTGNRIIRRLGVYFDTVLIADPVHLNSVDLGSLFNRDGQAVTRKVAIVQNLALVLQLNPLRSNNVDEPLFLIVPDISAGNPSRDFNLTTDYLRENLFKKRIKFSDALELFSLMAAGKIDLKGDYVDQSNLKYLLSYFRYNPDGEAHLISRNNSSSEIKKFFPHENNLGTLRWLFTKINESFDVYSRSLTNSLTFETDPIVPIDYWTPYKWFCEKIAPTDSIFSESHAEEVATVQGLFSDELSFLEAISLEELRKIREEGVFSDLRERLRIDRSVLKKATPDSLNALAQNFSSNLVNNVRQFGDSLNQSKKLTKKKRFRQVLSFAGSTGLSSLPFVFPTSIFLSILATGVGVIIGGKSALDIVQSITKSKKDKRHMVTSPLGIMYQAYVKNKKA